MSVADEQSAIAVIDVVGKVSLQVWAGRGRERVRLGGLVECRQVVRRRCSVGGPMFRPCAVCNHVII